MSLQQVISEPTRGENILDVLLVRQPDELLTANVGPPFLGSDHSSLSWSMPWSHSLPSPPRRVRAWRKADWSAISSFISDTDFSAVYHANPDPTQFCSFILFVLETAIEQFVPLVSLKNRSKQPSWICRLRNRRNRNFLNRKFSPSALLKFRRLDKKFRRAVYRQSSRIEDNLLQHSGLSSLSKFLKRRKGCGSRIPPLRVEGTTLSTPAEKAEALAAYFASHYTQDDGRLPSLPSTTHHRLRYLNLSPAAVEACMKGLKPKLSTGSDGLCSFFLRRLRSVLASPLSLLFQLCFAVGELPEQFLTSKVIPIYKSKGCPSQLKNYRPISLLSGLAKILDAMIAFQLSQYLESNQLLSQAQFGFRPQRSTTSQLLHCLNTWSAQLTTHPTVHVVYLDFSKAFDKLSHAKLTYKLSTFGISGPLLKFLSIYLLDRCQKVHIEDAESSPSPITSGSLQGSSYGPISFGAFLNDLLVSLEQLNVSVFAFADDIKLSSPCAASLQLALNLVWEWCDEWQMTLNPEKCEILSIRARRPRRIAGEEGLRGGEEGEEEGRAEVPLHLHLGGTRIPQSTGTVRDLGFHLSPSLSFSAHVSVIVNKAKFASRLAHRSILSPTPSKLCTAFKTFVRPLLEYGTPVWNQLTASDVRQLESVQRQFTRRIFIRCRLRIPSYEERLETLGLETLKKRRTIADLTFVHKVYFGHHFCPGLLVRKTQTRELMHNHRLLGEFRAKGFRSNFLPNRICTTWNSFDDNLLLSKPADFADALHHMNLLL